MEIELTAQAEAELIEIGDFIAKDNPSAAERFVIRLRERIEVLRKAARRKLISSGTPKARIQIKFRRRTDGDFCKIRVRGVKDKIAFDSDDSAWG